MRECGGQADTGSNIGIHPYSTFFTLVNTFLWQFPHQQCSTLFTLISPFLPLPTIDYGIWCTICVPPCSTLFPLIRPCLQFIKAGHECTRELLGSVPTSISNFKCHTWICAGFSHRVTPIRESKTREFSSTCGSTGTCKYLRVLRALQ
jgi:hypothetical protein